MTLELTHAVEDYFNSPEVPKGRVLPSALVLLGSHGRLDNLSDEGNFIKDEAFIWQGKQVVRRAGSSARGLLSAWVSMRIVSSMTFIDVQGNPYNYVLYYTIYITYMLYISPNVCIYIY